MSDMLRERKNLRMDIYFVAVVAMYRRSCVARIQREKNGWSASARREIERKRRRDERESNRRRDVNTEMMITTIQLAQARVTHHGHMAASAVVAGVGKGLSIPLSDELS